MTDKVIAVVANTKKDAERLARDLGHDTKYLFGSRSGIYFEGLRADWIFVDADADIPEAFMSTIRYTALKKGDTRVRRVRVRSLF